VSRRAPDPQSALYLVPRALLGSSVAILVLAALVNAQGQGGDGPEIVSWMAVGLAVAAPLLATLVRGRGLVAPQAPSGEGGAELQTRLQKTVVFFGLLESSVVFCAVALLACRPGWPFAAAVLPLAVMVLNLPPRAA
jgi:hypothetical protein